MRLPLPTPDRRRAPAAAWAAVGLALGLLARAGIAHAIEVDATGPRESRGLVVVEAHVTDAVPTRVAESLARGMPATLEVHAELWRHRTGWFDRLESSFDATVRIRYEVWNGTYKVERVGADPLTVGSADSLAEVLSRPWALPIARVGQLQARGRYYIVLTATLRPLSVEDVEEVEGWLSGEVENKRHAGFGVVTELPRSFFDAVRNFAGFGDRHARAVTPEFQLADLFAGDDRP